MKKWEALQKKLEMRKLQSSSFYSRKPTSTRGILELYEILFLPLLPAVTKQTRTIQFSLLSPGVLTTGWMVESDASKQRQPGNHRRKEKQSRRARERGRKLGVLPPAVLQGLSKASASMSP